MQSGLEALAFYQSSTVDAAILTERTTPVSEYQNRLSFENDMTGEPINVCPGGPKQYI